MSAAAPLVLLHGFAGSPAAWDGVCAALSAATSPPLRPWLPGHGPEAPPRDWEDAVDRIAAALPAGPPAHLAGYSLGGRLALGVLARHPHRLARVTLISARDGLAPDDAAARAERRAADARWSDMLEAGGLAAFFDAWDAQPVLAGRPEPHRDRLLSSPASLAMTLRVLGLAEMPRLAPALAAVATPVTLVAGADDPRFAAEAARLGAQLPRARTRIVPGAPHDLVSFAPRTVAAFLEE